MGSGVAAVSLGHCPVVLRDLSHEVLAEAAASISKGLQKRVRSESLTRRDAHQYWSRLHLTTRTEALRGADLVIEAVFEDLELKRRIVAETEELIANDAVFATNTSAIPVSQIAAGARNPQRILGMHYFSPVPRMPLLEIVVTRLTSARATATAHAFGRAQGKTCIVVQDGPGFYTTRILAPYLNEAVFLVQEGVGIQAVDQALRQFGYPVGPLALIDEVGIDVGAHVAADLGQAFAHRGAEPSDALPRLQEAGLLGRKNGKGFYVYPRGKGRKKPSPRIGELLDISEKSSLSAAEIQDRVALLMINEATRCLEEEIIRTPDDGDLGAVLGLGFPPFRGGPFRYIDAEGPSRLVDRLQRLADLHGARFQPSDLLRQMAKKGPRFHD
jgi:3-hydroxyacyl-CoA dehydrogenase/enoyl-CoA hydratase/3-hydroxybutyryl-CoA epimerase